MRGLIDHCLFYALQKKGGLAQTIYCMGPGKVNFNAVPLRARHRKGGLLRGQRGALQPRGRGGHGE